MTNTLEGIKAEAAGLGSRLGDWMEQLARTGRRVPAGQGAVATGRRPAPQRPKRAARGPAGSHCRERSGIPPAKPSAGEVAAGAADRGRGHVPLRPQAGGGPPTPHRGEGARLVQRRTDAIRPICRGVPARLRRDRGRRRLSQTDSRGGWFGDPRSGICWRVAPVTEHDRRNQQRRKARVDDTCRRLRARGNDLSTSPITSHCFKLSRPKRGPRMRIGLSGPMQPRLLGRQRFEEIAARIVNKAAPRAGGSRAPAATQQAPPRTVNQGSAPSSTIRRD